MTDEDHACERLEKYGKYSQEYSKLASATQLVTVISTVWYFSGVSNIVLYCYIYLILAVIQYEAGAFLYLLAFIESRQYFSRGEYDPDYINDGDAPKKISFIYKIKFFVWALIMLQAILTIAIK